MKSKFFGSNIQPACAYCANAKRAVRDDTVLCRYKGVVSHTYHCRRYCYSPLLRTPKSAPKLPVFTAEDFAL